MTTPIAAQIEEVEREISQRGRLYPKWIEMGRLRQETADAKLAALRDAQTSLTWLANNLDWIKPEAERRAREKRQAASLAAGHPATLAVQAAFPGAELTAVWLAGDGMEEGMS